MRAAPGVRGWDLQELVCDRFAAADYPTPISEPGNTRGYGSKTKVVALSTSHHLSYLAGLAAA